MSTKQLYEKTSEGMKEVSPLVAIEDIYSKLSDTTLEALVSLYNHVKCEWKGSVADTRRTVPLFLRRSGLFITYNNGTKYITEFFSAGTDQITTEGWVKDSNWTPVPDEDYISAGVKPGFGTIGYEQLSDNLKQLFREKVNVTNFPDDEDIASVDNMLKLKDREADVANFQSKGYVILRKNLRLVNGVVKNILTQNMISKPNTIYEIRYDFDANDETINIPENCTLKFKGGSLNNGTVVFNKTNIISIYTNNLFDNITFNGSFGEFDFKYLRNKDITTLMQFALDNIHYIHLPEGHFYISSPIVINNTGTIIRGEGRHNTYLEYIGTSDIENFIETKKKTTEDYYAVQMNTIRDIYLNGNNKVDNCINNQGPSCLFENLYIIEFKKNGIITNNSWCTHINNNIITYCSTGIYLESGANGTCIFENRIEANNIYDIRVTASADVSIINNVLESDCKTSILVLSCRNLNIKDNYFEGSRIMKGS